MGQLKRPFRGSVARKSGLVTGFALRHQYTRIYPDVYVHRDVTVDPMVRAEAVWCWSGGKGVLADFSAAALWGARWIDVDADGSIVLDGEHRNPPKKLIVRRYELATADECLRFGRAITSPARTAFDLARQLDVDTAVEAVDALYQATPLTKAHLQAYAETHRGARGIRRARAVIEQSDEGAESVWETRTRLAIIRAGLPRPPSQEHIFDAAGKFVARVDLCWPEWKVVVEYDGDHHFDPAARNRDIERWNAIEVAGYRVIRVKARQLMLGRALLIDQIRHVLREQGAPV